MEFNDNIKVSGLTAVYFDFFTRLKNKHNTFEISKMLLKRKNVSSVNF